MVDLNYELGKEHFSYDALRRELCIALIRNKLISGIDNERMVKRLFHEPE